MSYNELKSRGTEDFPIELYSIDASHPRYEMSAHWHSEVEIIRVLRGALSIRINENSYLARENEIIFVNSETVHQATPKDCAYECLVLSLDIIPEASRGAVYFTDSLKNHEYIINEYLSDPSSPVFGAVCALFSAMKEKSSGYKFRVIGAIYNLLGEIIDAHFYRQSAALPLALSKNTVKLRAVLAFIRSNYDAAITLEDMADAAGMSPKYFCYFFKEMTAKTPVQYLTLYRIENAARKLMNSDLSVTAVAYSCGFNDLSYFIKTFKHIKGITPAKFRKEALGF